MTIEVFFMTERFLLGAVIVFKDYSQFFNLFSSLFTDIFGFFRL